MLLESGGNLSLIRISKVAVFSREFSLIDKVNQFTEFKLAQQLNKTNRVQS